VEYPAGTHRTHARQLNYCDNKKTSFTRDKKQLNTFQQVSQRHLQVYTSFREKKRRKKTKKITNNVLQQTHQQQIKKTKPNNNKKRNLFFFQSFSFWNWFF